MYRPHAAREDTVLFPKLRSLVSAHEYDAMAEDFEKREHELFGEDGFGKMVHRVAALEQAVGIWDLSQFTAR
jgi:hemerythrin-like domain-containing protein